MTVLQIALLITVSLVSSPKTSPPIAQFANRYETGSGLIVERLEILPSGEFTFEYENDVDAPLIVHGVARVEDGVIRLEPSEPLSGWAWWNTHRRLVPVALGERLYLIPPEDRDEFCSDLRDRTEPRTTDKYGRWLLRLDDWKRKPGSQRKVAFCSQ